MSRSIRVRLSRRSRRGAPGGDSEDPAGPSGPEPGDVFEEFDPFPAAAPILPDPSLSAAERAEAEEEARQGIPTSAASAPSPGSGGWRAGSRKRWRGSEVARKRRSPG